MIVFDYFTITHDKYSHFIYLIDFVSYYLLA